MNKADFFRNIQRSILIEREGWCELEVLVDRADLKGVCYRSPLNYSHGSCYGNTWKEVFDKVQKFLEEGGHV